MKINEGNYEILKKAQEMTLKDYEIKWFNAENIDGFIDSEQMLYMIEDLICEVEHYKEQYQDLVHEVQEHYEYIKEPDPDVER